MARTPAPWWREERKEWQVTIQGKRHSLGEHPADCPAPKKKNGKWNTPAAIMQRFLDLQAKPAEKREPPRTSAEISVAEICDKYLEWCSVHRSQATYEFGKYRLALFLKGLEDPYMAVNVLRPFHVVEWIDTHKTWGPTFRRNLITVIQRPFNWAVKLGYIESSPIAHIEKPETQGRKQVIAPDAWPAIRDHYADGNPFRDLIEFAWEVGCRPQEVKKIEVRHVQLDRHRVIFAKSESKGKKRERKIYLTPRAEAILARLLPERTGIVFLNAHGKPWTGYSMNCRFVRLQKKLGVKYACYTLRHSFATRKLEEGVDHLTVAALMGHSDGTMVARVYGHLDEREEYLHRTLNQPAQQQNQNKDASQTNN